MDILASWCLLCGKDVDQGVAIKNLSKNLRITIGRFTRIKSSDKCAPKRICTNCDTFIRFYEKQKEHYQKVQEMFMFALNRRRNREELKGLRTKFGVSDELQDWNSLGLRDVQVKIEKLDTKLFENYIVESLDECFQDLETEFVVKAEPMSPRPASPESIPFLPQYSPESNPKDQNNSIHPTVAASDSEGLSDHFEITTKRRKIINPHKLPTKLIYECDLCGFTICWKGSIGRHMKEQHMKKTVQTFKCSKCPKVYRHKMSLRMHFDRKHGTRPLPTFPCELCKKSYHTKYQLKYHVTKDHENRKDHQCSVCSKMFHTRGNLKQHEIGHTETKDFHCTICPRQFSTATQLKRHIQRHNSVACFCDICGSKLASEKQLQVHKRFVHGGEMTHTCIVCGKDFKRPKVYKEHLIAIHTDLRPYSCRYCDRTFNNGSNFIKHKRETHPVEFAEDKKRIDRKSVVTLPSFDELHARIQAESV